MSEAALNLAVMYPKQEGAPMHPDELTFECDCWKCEWKYQRQLREWTDWNERSRVSG